MQIRIMTEVGTCFKNNVNLDAANVHCTLYNVQVSVYCSLSEKLLAAIQQIEK